ncbi:MAG: hypothetical protein BMS9Abin29_1653 [Gemmatimonadota bacterium]|nr:MAG: hypothetical protein BMS9Abin29_1653 [Gemmatimonadota bacterium]
MRVSDILSEDRIILQTEGRTLEDVLSTLVTAGSMAGGGDRDQKLVAELVNGVGEVFRVGEETVVVAAQTELVDDLRGAMAVASDPIEVLVHGAAPAACRVILLLLTPRRVATLRDQIIPAITRALRDRELEDQLTSATRPEQAFALTVLMDVELQEHLLVEDALISLNYRVYPDTPLPEIIDLMVRREVRAVPVVGEKYEVLGIITAGDAIKHLLPRFRVGEVEGTVSDVAEEPTARDVMSRTIMCVSEDQSLLEAANILVNRDLEQVPVVREGELVGFVNREVVLRLLSHPESSIPD